MDYLPVFLRVRGARASSSSAAGEVALRKAQWLLKAGARVRWWHRSCMPSLPATPIDAELTHQAAAFCAAHLAEAVAVVAATDDPAVNAAVSAAARARGIPVNVVDDAQLSTFIFPAIIDRSPLIVAVSSAGHAPVLARARARADRGAAARAPGRRWRASWGAIASGCSAPLAPRGRRAFWERIVGGPVATQVLAGHEAAAARGPAARAARRAAHDPSDAQTAPRSGRCT